MKGLPGSSEYWPAFPVITTGSIDSDKPSPGTGTEPIIRGALPENGEEIPVNGLIIKTKGMSNIRVTHAFLNFEITKGFFISMILSQLSIKLQPHNHQVG